LEKLTEEPHKAVPRDLRPKEEGLYESIMEYKLKTRELKDFWVE
jgi:hypothetical protein